MSEDKSKRVPAKKAKNSAVDKVLNFFKNLPANIVKPFKNTWRELRKVTWPPVRTDQLNLACIIFMVFMGVVIGLLDMGSTEVVKLLSSWAG